MSKDEDFNDNTNNIYVIRRRLAELKTQSPYHRYYSYNVGDFIIKISTTDMYNQYPISEDDTVVKHKVVDVDLFEMHRRLDNKRIAIYIDLETDNRFKNYKPIKYHELPGYSHGINMPIDYLCELIKYLHKLTNLVAFA